MLSTLPFTQSARASSEPVRVLLLADMVHPYIYRSGFPQGLGHIDLVLGAGDLPGYYLEFVASLLPAPVVYVPGNHQDEYVYSEGQRQRPGGAINAEGNIVRAAGLTIAGWGGVPRYRKGGQHQYTDWQGRWALGKLALKAQAQAAGQVDIFLTHAPPLGPHALSDFAHRGCPSISQFMLRLAPTWLVHGHIHEYEGRKAPYTDPHSGTNVINAYGYKVLEVARRVSMPQAAD